MWGFAIEQISNRSYLGMRLMQKPVIGRIAADKSMVPHVFDRNSIPRYFVPLKKGSDTECTWSRAVSIDSRSYADTEEEAVEAYNKKIDDIICKTKEEIKELEGMKI